MTTCRLQHTPINPAWELLQADVKSFEQVEKNRRLAWEKEHVARFAQIQEENERRFRTMQEEIDSLKDYIRHLGSGATVPTALQHSAPELPHDPIPLQDFSRDHLPNQDASYPSFVQGSSTNPTHQDNAGLDGIADTGDSPAYTRKRTTSPLSGDEESSEDGDLSLNTLRPSKRINGHDTRRLTIQVNSVVFGCSSLSLIVGLFE